jgi:hypothetical protein
MFAEAEVLMIWLLQIFETVECLKARLPDRLLRVVILEGK